MSTYQLYLSTFVYFLLRTYVQEIIRAPKSNYSKKYPAISNINQTIQKNIQQYAEKICYAQNLICKLASFNIS